MKKNTIDNNLTNGNGHSNDIADFSSHGTTEPTVNSTLTPSMSQALSEIAIANPILAANLNALLAESLLPTNGEPLSQSDRDEVLALIGQLRDQLPLLRDITADQRKSMLGMGDKNRSFAGKVLEVIQQNPDFLPRNFDIETFQQNLTTFDRLSSILMALNQVRDLVDATVIAIGTEAFEDALTAYRHAKASGHGASLESMMADMSNRFARKVKKKADGNTEAIE